MKIKHPTMRQIIREELEFVLSERKPMTTHQMMSTIDYIKMFHPVKTEIVEEAK